MSGSKKPIPKIAWDSCIFLAWFKKETDKPLDTIRLFIEEIEKGNLALYVSAVSYAEVLDTSQSSDAGTRFRQFMDRSNVVTLDVDRRVAEEAAKIRQDSIRANKLNGNSPKLKAPDALIAATCVIYRVKELHSFDRDLLAYNNHPVVSKLSVIKPHGGEGDRSLFEGVEHGE